MQVDKKKIVSSLITTILIVSVLALPAPLTEAQADYVTIDEEYPKPSEGTVGTEVTINGTVPTAGGPVGIYWDTWENKLTEAYSTATGYGYEAYGVYEITFKVPETPAGPHTIIVKDEATGKTATATFEVKPEIVLTPESGLPGDTITISGTGFAAEKIVTLTFDDEPLTTTPEEIKTSSLGSFTATFEVPSTAEIRTTPSHTVTATDQDGNSASASFTVDYYITVEPTSSPPGVTVDVSGRIESSVTDVEVRFGTGTFWLTAFTTSSDEKGYFSGTYTIPSTLDAGTYYFKVMWDEEYRETTFEVSTPPSITLSPTEQYPGKEVTVTGFHFCSNANVTVYFDNTVVNDTVTTDDAGSFEAKFTVPSVAAGIYKVKAVDQYGASAEAYLTVKRALVIVIETRATEYLQGDTISIYGNCSEAQAGTLKITDPDGRVFWSDSIDTNDWEAVGDWQLLKWEKSIACVLPSEAPIGTWNFTAYDSAGKILDTNLFTVSKAALPGVEDLTDRVSALEESMAALSQKLEALSDKVDTLSTAVAGINLQALSTAIESVRSDVESLKTDISDISTTVSGVQSAVQNAVDAAGEAKSAAESASSAVSNISTAVYGAIILSLIAAVAAIMAVVTLQRKIAG